MSHHRVKHPCKICSQSVNNKTGLQCKGACRKWAHFKCLNYSASKIECIKAGELKIICPCPNCNTGEANLPKSSKLAKPCCRKPCCPLSPTSSTSPQSSQQQLQSPPSLQKPPDSPQSSPKQCGSLVCPKKCSRYPLCSLEGPSSTSLQKQASPPHASKQSTPPSTPPKRPICPLKWPISPKLSPKRPVSPPSPPKRPISPPSPPKRPISPHSYLPKLPASPPFPAEPYPVPPTPAPTVAPPSAVKGDFNHIAVRKTKSCSCGVCKQDEIIETSVTLCKSESDTLISKSKENQQKLYCTIEQLCNTVGLLSTQIKDLVGRLVTGKD